MNFYITSGTPEFMYKIKEKYPKEQIYLLHGTGNTVLLHETNGKSLFQMPRTFEILDARGNFKENGYFVLYHIPLSDEGKPIFEFKYANLSSTVDNEPGFYALRVLKPVKSDTYIILTEWSSANSYEVWEKAQDFDFTHMEDKQKIFTSAPYKTIYRSKPNEEEE